MLPTKVTIREALTLRKSVTRNKANKRKHSQPEGIIILLHVPIKPLSISNVVSPANLPLPRNPYRSALRSSRRQLQVAGAEKKRKKKRNVAHRAKHHVRSSHRAGKLCRTRTNFFLLPSPPLPPHIPLFLSIPNISSHSFQTKMYVLIGEGGGAVRCLFVTAKRDFCGNGEKNCNRDLWSVSIDADLVFFFFISSRTRAWDL